MDNGFKVFVGVALLGLFVMTAFNTYQINFISNEVIDMPHVIDATYDKVHEIWFYQDRVE